MGELENSVPRVGWNSGRLVNSTCSRAEPCIQKESELSVWMHVANRIFV